MSLYIASINSGSNGNCYYVGNSEEAILVDAGISCREIEKRLARLSLSMASVKALFISHEHGDHIRGVEVLSKKYRLPVYITNKTLNNCRLNIQEELVRNFEAYKPVRMGNIFVTAFPKKHDAADPHSFIVSGNGVNIGVLTDIGFACDHVTAAFQQCHAVFLESNYDEESLENGSYPYYLKKRIQSDIGHLSNAQALQLFKSKKADFLSHVFLCHLSHENNSPEIAHSVFADQSPHINISVAPRDRESELFFVENKKFEKYVPKKITFAVST